MSTYFEFVPNELISEIISYIPKYRNIISFAKFLKYSISEDRLDNLFRNSFINEYPLISQDIDKVINDDIYLNDNYEKLPRYMVLYAIFKDTYDYLEDDILSIENIDKLDDTGMVNPDIVYRAAFNKLQPDIYNKIVKLESYNKDGLLDLLSSKLGNKRPANESPTLINYWYHGLYWRGLFYLVESRLDTDVDNVLMNIIDQSNNFDILDILINDDSIKQYIIDNLHMNAVLSLIDMPINKKLEDLFKFIYTNEIGPTDEYTWEYLMQAIRTDNYNLAKWLLDNGEDTWKDNPEFDELYEGLKTESKKDSKAEYDKLLDKYK